jgi:hypothetical protein
LLLAAVELLGAALFAFEAQVVAGLGLLLLSFLAASVAHLQHGEMAWWLVAYTLVATVLWRFTVRARRAAGPSSKGAATG